MIAGGLLHIGLLPARAASLEYPIETGYAFVRGAPPDGPALGFVVQDADGVGLWTAYQHLGGRDVLGLPLGERYPCGSDVCQAFERALLRWDATSQDAVPVDVLTDLGDTDGWLAIHGVLHGQLSGLTISPPPPAFDLDQTAGTDVGVEPAEFALGQVVAIGRAGSLVIVRGTRGALLEPGGGAPASVLGAGEIALAAGRIPATALVTQPLPDSTASSPARLIVPRLGLNTPLMATDPNADGSLPAPDDPQTVVWYTDSARLAEGGTILLAGHVDWVGRQAAFRYLAAMQPGDEIVLEDVAGSPTVYRVTDTGRYGEDDPVLRELMVNRGIGPPTLVLVTCGGPFDLASRSYLERQVVVAAPVTAP